MFSDGEVARGQARRERYLQSIRAGLETRLQKGDDDAWQTVVNIDAELGEMQDVRSRGRAIRARRLLGAVIGGRLSSYLQTVARSSLPMDWVQNRRRPCQFWRYGRSVDSFARLECLMRHSTPCPRFEQ